MSNVIDSSININGMKKSDALTMLIQDHGKSYLQAEEYWKSNGARTKSTGFRAEFYDALRDGAALTEKRDLIEFMQTHGASANDIKQYTHYLAISRLVDDVRS